MPGGVAAVPPLLFVLLTSVDPFYQLDLGLHKQFPLRPEGTSFDFRVEAFNVLNQTNYAFPQSSYSPSSTSFGVVAAASTFPARILQFAGKIIF